MIISFSHTTPSLLAGRKTVTRRNWSDRTAAYFTKRLADARDLTKGVNMAHLGIAADAYDKSPRHGGRKVATIAVESVTRERLSDMPDSDYEAEGFAWLAEQGIALGDVWDIVPSTKYPSLSQLAKAPDRKYFDLAQMCERSLWVVRFRLLRVLP